MMGRKKVYSKPVLKIHGTAEEITKQPPKGVDDLDGKGGHPYGKVTGAEDAMDSRSRS